MEEEEQEEELSPLFITSTQSPGLPCTLPGGARSMVEQAFKPGSDCFLDS